MRSLFVLCTCIQTAAISDADDTKAVGVITRAIDAHGGADVLKKFRAGHFVLKGTDVRAIDNVVITCKYSLPDYVREKSEYEYMNVKCVSSTIFAKDDLRVYNRVEKNIVTDKEVKEGNDRFALRTYRLACQLTPLLDGNSFVLDMQPDADGYGTKASLVIATEKRTGAKLTLALDQRTGLLLRVALGSNDQVFSEYKKVNGVQLPMRVIRGPESEAPMTFKVEKYDLFESLDAKEFKSHE